MTILTIIHNGYVESFRMGDLTYAEKEAVRVAAEREFPCATVLMTMPVSVESYLPMPIYRQIPEHARKV